MIVAYSVNSCRPSSSPVVSHVRRWHRKCANGVGMPVVAFWGSRPLSPLLGLPMLPPRAPPPPAVFLPRPAGATACARPAAPAPRRRRAGAAPAPPRRAGGGTAPSLTPAAGPRLAHHLPSALPQGSPLSSGISRLILDRCLLHRARMYFFWA